MIEPIFNIGVEYPDCEFYVLGLVFTTLSTDINHNMILFFPVLFNVCYFFSVNQPRLFFRILRFVSSQMLHDICHSDEDPDD